MGEETIMQTAIQQRWNVWVEMKNGKTEKIWEKYPNIYT